MGASIDGEDQDALFKIEGPDEDGCVWVCSTAGRDVWCQNLGPRQKVAETLIEWLAQQDHGERPEDWDRVRAL